MTADRVIDAVVFDFGGVYTPSPFDVMVELGARLGVDPLVASRHVFGSYHEDTDHPWHRAERGEIDVQVARDAILEAARSEGLEIDLFEAFKLMGGTGGEVRTEMVDRTRRLRADGYRTGLVTNNLAEFRDFWRPLLPLDELFDVVVDSSEVGIRKPDPRIFTMTLELLGGIAPARSVFLDDAPGNVDAARALGMHGVLVGPGYLDAIDELDAILVRTP